MGGAQAEAARISELREGIKTQVLMFSAEHAALTVSLQRTNVSLCMQNARLKGS